MCPREDASRDMADVAGPSGRQFQDREECCGVRHLRTWSTEILPEGGVSNACVRNVEGMGALFRGGREELEKEDYKT